MAVTLTEAASSEIRRIMESEKREDAFVRMHIIGGGCSGLQYQLGFDTEFDPKADARYDHNGVSLVTRKKFALHLDGTTTPMLRDQPSVGALPPRCPGRSTLPLSGKSSPRQRPSGSRARSTDRRERFAAPTVRPVCGPGRKRPQAGRRPGTCFPDSGCDA